MAERRSPSARACLTPCTLEQCVETGCWLEAARVGTVLPLVMQRLVDDAAQHGLVCPDPAGLPFAHPGRAA
jgi:hypothetical protein